ncbi:uncharacterized protein DNG_05105 [Cephalotrichum gorgonifer]|uniref:Uncharacterized protein n=1 Tax=Cephalotrichum gorgonifer TaxID=2041049 RepID=A0AAE8SVZ3_9PEZI|nr:uncharacterized protein DNG_05105 [Cephalotrichum gorgonifer]
MAGHQRLATASFSKVFDTILEFLISSSGKRSRFWVVFSPFVVAPFVILGPILLIFNIVFIFFIASSILV